MASCYPFHLRWTIIIVTVVCLFRSFIFYFFPFVACLFVCLFFFFLVSFLNLTPEALTVTKTSILYSKFCSSVISTIFVINQHNLESGNNKLCTKCRKPLNWLNQWDISCLFAILDRFFVRKWPYIVSIWNEICSAVVYTWVGEHRYKPQVWNLDSISNRLSRMVALCLFQTSG